MYEHFQFPESPAGFPLQTFAGETVNSGLIYKKDLRCFPVHPSPGDKDYQLWHRGDRNPESSGSHQKDAEMCHAYLRPGIFSGIPVFSGEKEYSYTLAAEKRSTVLWVPVQVMEEMLEKDRQLLYALLLYVSQRGLKTSFISTASITRPSVSGSLTGLWECMTSRLRRPSACPAPS